MEDLGKHHKAPHAEESSAVAAEDIETKAGVRIIHPKQLHEKLNLAIAQSLMERPRKKKPAKRTSPWASVPMPVFGPVDTEEFLCAAIQGKQQVVEKYLCDNGNPNACDKYGRTALHRASMEGHLPVVRNLLEKGANVHCQDGLDSQPVHWACRGGRLEVVAVLKDHGVDLNSRDKLHSTPLHVATRTGHADIVEYLLCCGVKINCRDREGDTALHDAVRLRRCGIVKLLLAAGADAHIRNHVRLRERAWMDGWLDETKAPRCPPEGLTALEQVKQWHFDTMEVLQRVEQLRGAGSQASGEE